MSRPRGAAVRPGGAGGRARAAALALALAFAAPALAAPARWHRAATPHFVLYAQADRDSVTRLARNLESMAQLLEWEGFGVRAAERQRVSMVAIPGNREFQSHLPLRGGRRAELSGIAHKTPFGTWIGFAADDDRGRMVAHHELVHTIVDAALGGAPLCMNEGLAEFYSGWRATARGGRYGETIPWHAYVVRHEKPFTLDELFAIDADSPRYARGDAQKMFYAQSWAVAHYLMRVDGRSRQFRELALAIAGGAPSRRAFERVFPGESWDQIPNKLSGHVSSGKFPSWEIRLDEPPGTLPVEVREAPRAEVDAHLGLWRALETEVDAGQTRALLERAAAGPSEPGLALAGLGMLEQRLGREAEALRRFRAAAAAPRATALALSVAGGGMLMQAATAGVRDLTLAAEALAVLERSIALDSTDAVALGWYGRAALGAGKLSSRALRALETAATALPTDAPVASAWASALSRSGQPERAREVLATHAGLGQNREIREATGANLAFDAFRDSASALAKAGRYDLLERLLDHTANRSDDDQVLAAVRSLREQLAAARLEQRWVDRYNEGVRALGAGQLANAQRAFAAVRDSAADAKIRGEAAARTAELAGMIEFDRGMQAFKKDDFATAAAAFDRARDLAKTDELREKAAKNADIARKAAARGSAKPPGRR